MVSLFALLAGRLGQVQLLPSPAVDGTAGALATRTFTTKALRGRILDAAGRPLATNTFTTTVTIERKVLLDDENGGRELVTRVARVLDRPFEQVWAKTMLCGTRGAPPAPACFNGSPYAPIPLATRAPADRALTLVEQPEKYPGVAVVAEPARAYPGPNRANTAHLLGYVTRASADDVSGSGGRIDADDIVGRAGLEAQYDAVLRGTNGSTVVTIDPRGAVTGTVAETAPVNGRDVITHLDARLQARTEVALASAVKSARARKQKADVGAAVVLDVTTGAVVAAASYPTYDPNVFSGGISQSALDRISSPAARVPLRSRLTAETFAPASTFKVISVPAAIRDGASLKGTYQCPASLTVAGRVFSNDRSIGYGPIDLRRALVVSCDTVFYRFAYTAWQRLGGLTAPTDVDDPFVTTARGFGIGTRTGIDLPGESAGRLPDRESKVVSWAANRAATCRRAKTGYPEVATSDPKRATYLKTLAVENCRSGYEYRAGDAVNFSIGQGDLAVTPLQMAGVYAAVANGGTRWQPQVAAGYRSGDGTLMPIPPRKRARAPLPADVGAYLRSALADVTRPGGSAAGAFVGYDQLRYPVAGKTGTGEVFGKQATAWFAGYGPTTKPKYAVVVVVGQGGSGSRVAAPVVRRVFEAIAALGL